MLATYVRVRVKDLAGVPLPALSHPPPSQPVRCPVIPQGDMEILDITSELAGLYFILDIRYNLILDRDEACHCAAGDYY